VIKDGALGDGILKTSLWRRGELQPSKAWSDVLVLCTKMGGANIYAYYEPEKTDK
jgi:hypothetical protein